jgi:hypothetical protein
LTTLVLIGCFLESTGVDLVVKADTLECAPLKVSCLNPPGVTFYVGVIQSKNLALNDPPLVDSEIVSFGLVGFWAGYGPPINVVLS